MTNDMFNEREQEHLDDSPEGSTSHSASSKSKSKYDTTGKSLRQKLEMLNELLVDECINNLSTGKTKPNDLGAIVTLLKNNKVVEEKREVSESDLIDELIEDR